MRGYYTNVAQIIGVESRTSSIVKVPKGKETLEYIYTKRLFQFAEGACNAGRYLECPMDGEHCAEKLLGCI